VPPYVVETGARIVDRYRLEQALGETGSTSYWRAQDELLDRPVGVCLLGKDADNAGRILSAARQAAAVSDPRFLRVLDASDTGDMVYVVTEWVAASSLADLLTDGPMSPGEARVMVAEIARALEAAHQQGLGHLCLQPEHILRTTQGQVKVAGLAVDAAVRGVHVSSPQDANRRDVEGCAAVLYAALTARWPGDEQTALSPAPRENGILCAPRQVRAGVPDDLDEIASRALIARHRAGSRPLKTLDELVSLLGSAHVTTRMPAVGPAPAGGPDDTPYPPSYLAAYDDTSRGRRRALSRLAWVLAALVLTAGLGLAAWQLATAAFDGGSSGDTDPTTGPSQTTSTNGRSPVEVVGISSFDPPPGDGEENGDRAERVLDGDISTVWTTKTYFDQFGPSGLKEGVGLVLDLGRGQSVSSVAVTLRGNSSDVELRTSDEEGRRLEDFDVVGEVSGRSGLVEIEPKEPVETRYLLVWLTALPQVDGGSYRGTIAEIQVRG